MNRIGKPTDDEHHTISPTTPAATSPNILQPATSEHTGSTLRRTTKGAAGKRKRIRSHMTTASTRSSLDDVDVSMDISSPKRARPSLSESHHSAHSDEDDEAVRFSVPPPPPTEPVPLELLCRYPNKPCPQERATKKHGELHSYCAYHRFKAQQYQRKLEQKKRERRLREQRSPSTLLQATSLSGNDTQTLGATPDAGTLILPHHKSLSPPHRRQPVRARTRSSPPRPSGAIPSGAGKSPSSHNVYPAGNATNPTLEPFHHPVSLQEGDLQLLQVFLWDGESPPTAEPPSSRISGPGHPDARNESRGSDAYNVNLDGFTFTSESL